MSTTTYGVVGMTCEHCVRAVSDELGALPAVSSVAVELVPGGTSLVTLAVDGDLAEADVVAALDEAGYELAPRARP
jgi:copper chaperone